MGRSREGLGRGRHDGRGTRRATPLPMAQVGKAPVCPAGGTLGRSKEVGLGVQCRDTSASLNLCLGPMLVRVLQKSRTNRVCVCVCV